MGTTVDGGIHLLVDPAVRGPVLEEDADDVHVSAPGGQVQREAPLAVGQAGGRLELQQLQDHVPGRQDTDTEVNAADGKKHKKDSLTQPTLN